MANYIGNAPANGEFKHLDSIASQFNGSTTTFSLLFNGVSQSVGDASQLIVSLNGVVQEPLTAYTLGSGGSTIIFSSAPASGGTCFIIKLGGVGSTSTPLDGSVDASKLAANLKDYLEEEYVANGSQTTYTLTRAVSGTSQILLTIDGVVQPTSAYSVSGTTLTISPALPNTTDVRVVHMGIAGAFNAANSITSTMLSPTGGTANQVLAVNASANGIEFQTVSSGAAGQTITTITANTTLSNSDKGKLIQTETAGITITIPALSSLDADWFVDIETLNTNTFNHGKITLDITTNNSGASINRSGNETMYGASKVRLQRSPAGGDSQGQLSAFASNYLTGGIIVREDRLAGGLQGGDVGVGSIMLGNAQDASGNDAIAIGQLGSATGTGSVAIGSYNGSSATTVAAATGAVAIGSGRAGGNQSLALQIQNSSTSYGASGANSVAIGYQAKATRDPSIALGHQANATGTGSQAFGYMASATGNYSTAIGLGASANQSDQIAIGGTGKPVKIANRYTLPIADGTNGQVMTTNGSGVISFADAGGDYVHISTTNITSSTASVEVTLPTGYDRFEFIFDLYSAGQAHVYFQTSQDAGSNWLVNNYKISNANSTYSPSLTWTSAAYSGVLMSDRAKYLAGSVKIHRASETSATRFVSHASGFDGAGLTASLQNASGMSTAQTARINKVKFLATGSYTYSSGKISLYGIKDN